MTFWLEDNLISNALVFNEIQTIGILLICEYTYALTDPVAKYSACYFLS